jgi:hypothetical protein
MNRREFVTMMALSLVGIVAGGVPTAAQAKSRGGMIKGTADGKILASADAGKSWQIKADFGPDISVLDIRQDGPYAYAQLGFQSYSFWLRSSDGAKWWTV